MTVIFSIAIILLFVVGVVFLIYLFFFEWGGYISKIADLLFGLFIGLELFLYSPIHPQNKLFDYGLYILLTLFIMKLISHFYLISYSANFMGFAIIYSMLEDSFSGTAKKIVTLILLISPKIMWIASRNLAVSVPVDGFSTDSIGDPVYKTKYEDWNGDTVTEYYKLRDWDARKKILDIYPWVGLVFQIVVSLGLYTISHLVIFVWAFDLTGDISVKYGILALAMAIANVLVDYFFLGGYDMEKD